MRSSLQLMLCSAVLTASCLPALASPHVRRGPTAPRLAHAHTAKAAAHFITPHVGMASERATQIQTALIKAGYLTGTPSGTWDAQSQEAMEKLQADNGWQTKIVPDSRAIIKLGLGPNSITASTATPVVTDPPDSSGQFSGDAGTSRPSNQ